MTDSTQVVPDQRTALMITQQMVAADRWTVATGVTVDVPSGLVGGTGAGCEAARGVVPCARVVAMLKSGLATVLDADALSIFKDDPLALTCWPAWCRACWRRAGRHSWPRSAG